MYSQQHINQPSQRVHQLIEAGTIKQDPKQDRILELIDQLYVQIESYSPTSLPSKPCPNCASGTFNKPRQETKTQKRSLWNSFFGSSENKNSQIKSCRPPIRMQPNRSNLNQSSQSNIKYDTPTNGTNVVSDNEANNTPISSISSITNSIRPHINNSNKIIQQSNSSGNLVTLPTVQPKIKPLDSEDLEQQQRKQQYKGSVGFVPHQNDNDISFYEKVVNGNASHDYIIQQMSASHSTMDNQQSNNKTTS